MKGRTRGIVLTVCLVTSTAFAEDEQRDFYAEPGLNPFKTSAGQDVTEHIDPFSGNLQLSYVDLSVPGNGGLDIAITRHYNLPQSSPGYANPFGYGWTMHFGRITIASGDAARLCNAAELPGGDTLDNPSIEMPDGGRELLVRSAVLGDGTYITKSNWKAECIDPGDYTRGVVTTSPDGTAYYMTEYVFMQGEDGPAGEPAPTVETWLTNRIVDARGNSADIGYLTIANGMKLVTHLETSDGRQVLFEYVEPGGVPATAASSNARLAAITANGQTWTYEHAPIEGGTDAWGSVYHYKLTAVLRPDGTRWGYTYGQEITEPEYNRLVAVVYPSGGEVNYAFQWVRPYLPNPDFRIAAIEQKTQENPNQASGTWRWEFNPGHTDFAELGVQPLPDNAGRLADFTRITTPVGEEHVYHVGYWALVDTHNILWQMGLKIIHQVFEPDPGGGLRLLRSVSNSWDRRTVSDEVYRGGILSALWDEKVYAPVLRSSSILLDGYNYTTEYADYDMLGNPGTITEWAIYPTEGGNRITDYGYRNDTVGWFIGLPVIETVSQDGTTLGTIERSYDASGLLVSEDRFGVVTNFTYTEEGDLASVTDALGNTTRYGNYFRGQARLEDRPDSTRLTRTVNSTGTVASRTSGRGHTTAFTYDGLNRLTGIDYPRGHDVTITWNPDGKSLTRGPYREEVSWDGFGREVEVIRRDLSSGESFTRTFVHDALGRRTFESDVNSTGGIEREYDGVDRIIRIVNQDGTTRLIAHDGAHREIHRDENGNSTDYRYQVYGSPENRHLAWVLAPESIGTRILRDALGNIESLFQGERDPANPEQYLGYSQNYSYNERRQLTAIDSSADIGLTSYGRDLLGNMTSRQVGSGNPVSFTYDAMNRLIRIDYLEDQLDVTYSYDADGNPTSIANAFAVNFYAYDENGNLTAEEVEIAGSNYPVRYTVDDLDHIATVHYPSGRSLELAPDALGRATRALPYLSSISYFPEGSLRQLGYANGRVVNYTETPRHWVDTIDAGTFAGLDYDYDDAGNVTAIGDLKNPASSREMTYDGLNRLKTAGGAWGSANYLYDAFGNLLRKSDPAQGNRSQSYHYRGLLLDRMTYEGSQAQRVFSYDDLGNVSYSDDAIFDPVTGLPAEVLTRRQQVFDDAGHMAYTVRTGRDESGNIVPLRSGSFSSEYDATNHRVRKINHSDNNRVTDYVYSRSGLLLGEYDAAGIDHGHEYFYLGNLQIASAKLNAPPNAEAGEDLQASAGTTVVLSASYSDLDGEVVAVEWQQLSGPPVVIDDPYTSDTFFTAPQTTGSQTIVLQFTVTDDRGGQSAATLTVTVEAGNAPPPIPDSVVLPGDRENLVTWEVIAGATGYTVYWSPEPERPIEQWTRVAVGERPFLHPELSNGTSYYYRIEARNEYGRSGPGPTVAATPGPHQWQAARQIPDDLTLFDPSATRVAVNGLGDFAIVSRREEGGIYRLRVRQFGAVGGFSDSELIDESQEPQQFLRAALDAAGNLLVAWASGPEGGRSLYSIYRPHGESAGSRQPVEFHSPDAYVTADVLAVSHLEFADDGRAYLCWRQNLLHVFNNYYDPAGASALVKRFEPGVGWVEEHNLEVKNNVGDTRNLSCDVSGNGRVIAAWERYNIYDPQPISLGGREYDVWVAAYEPASGWSGSETVEYLATGEREYNGRGVHNRLPHAAVSSDGAGSVVWFNETDTRIDSIDRDFSAASWMPQQTIESRANRIPAVVTPLIDSNETGDSMIAWDAWYTTRPADSAGWGRPMPLPDTPLETGVDEIGEPYIIHQAGSDLVAGRLEAGSWEFQTLGDSSDPAVKSLIQTGTGLTDALWVYWTSDQTLYLSTDQLPVALPSDPGTPDTTPPVTTFSTRATRVKGSTRHEIVLAANEPASTFYLFTGQGTITAGGINAGDWQEYQEPVSIELEKKGEGMFRFYSRDEAGNSETTRTEVLQ